MKTNYFRTLSSIVLVAVSAAFMFSCGDDDDKDANDCSALSSQLSTKSDELIDALMDGDCDAVEKAYNDLIDLYQDGNECDAYKKAVKDAGFESYEEYVDYLEDIRDVHLSDC